MKVYSGTSNRWLNSEEVQSPSTSSCPKRWRTQRTGITQKRLRKIKYSGRAATLRRRRRYRRYSANCWASGARRFGNSWGNQKSYTWLSLVPGEGRWWWIYWEERVTLKSLARLYECTWLKSRRRWGRNSSRRWNVKEVWRRLKAWITRYWQR